MTTVKQIAAAWLLWLHSIAVAQPSLQHGQTLSLHLQQTDVRVALEAIANFTGLNVVVADNVSGSITLRLKDVPWEQALDVILTARNLGMKREGNVVWIAPRMDMLARQQQELEIRQTIQSLEPVQTQGFRLHYARAHEVAAQLKTSTGQGDKAIRLLGAQGSVFAETRTNQVFVTDTPDKLQQVARLIEALDIPVRQVLIEARMVEADEAFGHDLAVRLGVQMADAARVGSINGRPVRGQVGLQTGTSVDGVAEFSLALLNPALTPLLNLEITANETQRRIKTLSSPRVVTADQQQATIEDGRKFPFLRRDADGNSTVVFIDASLKLVVKPHITPDGDVLMQLEVKNDSPIVFNDQTAIQTKSVSTQVLVENGGTVVIGGIFSHEDLNSRTQTPGLGDVPVLGHLFRSRSSASRRSEMMVFITPRVLPDFKSTAQQVNN
jgi:type IV pilus assembly protein PilQ